MQNGPSISTQQKIDLETPLSLRSAFRYPMQSALARREVLIGALILCIPIYGWLVNMGHRIAMTHRMQHGLPAWPAWRNFRALLYHGTITFLGMAEYHAPAVICGFFAWRTGHWQLYVAGAVLWIVATASIPGYMTHYCFSLDPREVFNPLRAMRRVFEGGRSYWHAWLIALSALGCSFLGLLALGAGFLITSVWFWQVAGFSFATVFSQKFRLADAGVADPTVSVGQGHM
jgi:hypothetical protein